jgi:hypothetical protein
MKRENQPFWSSHAFLMILCCLIPLVGIVLLSSFGILGDWGFYAMILLCPLLHFLLMKKMSFKNLPKKSTGDPGGEEGSNMRIPEP